MNVEDCSDSNVLHVWFARKDLDEVNFSAVNTIQEDHKIMLTAFCVDYVVVSKLKLTVQKYQSINENRVFRLVKMILSKNLILPILYLWAK